MNTPPMHVLCIGECMLELRSAGDQYASAFAGDVSNFAIYLKRLYPPATVDFLSAVGNDSHSDQLCAFLEGEGLETRLLFRSTQKTLGLYMIDTDANGERSFSYWRSDSAARTLFSLLDADLLEPVLASTAYLYFSGITLAILNQEDREKLFLLAERCRQQGIGVVFDPNYRPRLWQDAETASTQIKRAIACSDTVLSSIEDQQLLFGELTAETLIAQLEDSGVREIVLTDGPGTIVGSVQSQRFTAEPATASQVVDTTSAGDAFNAGYLAARHLGIAPAAAAQRGSTLAATVVAHPGAIIPGNLTPRLL